MNEGKELLYKIIEDKLNSLSTLDSSVLYIGETNLKELLSLLESNQDNFYKVSNNVIEYIIEKNNIKNPDSFKKNAINARDLLIGKKDYNLKVSLSKEQENVINTIIRNLNIYISSLSEDLINKELLIKEIQDLKKKLDKNELINEFEFIEKITKDYDEYNFDKHMVVIMTYINEANLNLMKIKKKNAPLFDIHLVRRPKIDNRIKEVLDKLEIKTKDLPNYLLSEIKNADPDEFVNTYNILRRNKAENGGLLHFFKKDDLLLKLIVILYSNDESIRGVIESIKGNDGTIDINILKSIINNIPTCLFIKNNNYFKPNYHDFISNIKLLKELKVNYKVLIQKTPLFMIMNHEILDYTLNYLEKYGATKKNIINRCYKTLATDPSLLIDNLEILKNYNIDLVEFFGPNNTNYNLLKITDLENKIIYFKSKNNELNLDYDILNKLIITKVYNDANAGIVSWGEK